MFKSKQPSIFVGVHYLAPFYYFTGIEVNSDYQFIKIFETQILLEQWEFQPGYLYIASLPWRLFQFKHIDIKQYASCYLGLNQGHPCYSKAELVHSTLDEQLVRWGSLARYLHILEIDVYALWHLAYWYLQYIDKRDQVLLWLYQTSNRYYVFLGREDMLWQVQELSSLSCLKPWLDSQPWPIPKRLILFHAMNTDGLSMNLPIMQLTDLQPAKLLAWGLGLRGAYAAI